MTTLATVLNGAAVITTAAAPTLGNINRYNASSGALAVTLPALSGLNIGASCLLEKDTLDTTLNTITFTANSGDTLDDAATSFGIFVPGEKINLQVESVAGTKYWKVAGATHHRNGVMAGAAQVAVTNTTTATDLITATLPAGKLYAGASFRVELNGTVQTSTTASSSLTFTPFIQGTALAQTAVMASTGTANAASAFKLELVFTVRTTGATGTAIAKPYGAIHLATTGVVYLNSASATATTVNTLAAAGSNVLKVQATWGAASATNSLLVETATIERIV